ncbi:MAG TPA: PP2C family protein-serine/threonine phosphatase [Terracidiphilus sp.]|nr:PP2C family protein-serine/threonine phosphatase [Terracidiphilus sp.]
MTTHEAVVDVSQDWLQACSVQQQFMRGPAASENLVDFSAGCRQLRALGGDCYDFTSLPDGRLTMLIGDASGKGVAAALMMASVQASLRTAALFAADNLAAMLRVVNLQACASSLADRYATLFYGVLDRESLTLRYINAGHNPPLLLHPDGSFTWLEPSGPPVGIFPDASWCEGLIRLQRGDLVVAYTDGVTETFGPSGTEWGVEGLVAAAASIRARSADTLVQSIFDSIDDFSAGNQHDDATVAALRIL